MFVNLIIAIVIEIAVLCYSSCAREYPRNYVLLGIFTFCFSYIVATICSAYFLALENGGIDYNLRINILNSLISLNCFGYDIGNDVCFDIVCMHN